jgi:Heterokaryon incompatibility protein (HET)
MWISTRPLDPDVNRPEAVELAKQWLFDCTEHHERCRVSRDAAAGSIFSPKRLLKIQNEFSDFIKVKLLLCEANEHQPYAALSYCWGGTQIYTLNLANLEALCIDIPLSSLPQTLQDTISVTSRLGIHYLWVDALCIIQDSTIDKGEEISMMHHIYQHAELTICAASSAACTEGFLQKRSFGEPSMPVLECSALQFPCPSGVQGTIFVRESQHYWPFSEPLYQRAWTLQEQVLSSRVLVYSSWQVWWECLEVKKCDRGNPYNIGTTTFIGDYPLNGMMEHIEQTSRDSNNDPDVLWNAWKQLIGNYSARDLSIATDKLPAVSGLASRFSRLWGCAYYAGLWECMLVEGLNWYVFEPLAFRLEEYCAPSWSWASAIGAIVWEYDDKDDTQEEDNPVNSTRIIECKVKLANDAAKFSQVTDGSLRIEGSAQRIEWDGQEQIEAKGLDSESCPVKSTVLGSPLYPEGIIARAQPDYSQTELFCISQKKGFNTVPPEPVPTTFYMGGEEAPMNEITMPVLLVVISRKSALMLFGPNDDIYERLGLLCFKSEADLKSYFEGCDTLRVTIW